MSQHKKDIRRQFRDKSFRRDKYRCRVCGFKPPTAAEITTLLDCHHINSRDLMPAGGYVPENGISLCADCHIKAEEYWRTGTAIEGYSPEDLYKLIGSSYELAVEMSLKLEKKQ